ncbi:DUF2848 family protein [Nocardia sp. NPDC003963]
MSTPALALTVAGSGEQIELRPRVLVVAGYTGRDEAAVREHIDELAAIGISPPPRVPMRYDLDPGLLSTAPAHRIAGAATSGEVEPVLLRHTGHWYVGVGSDHTDRALEREDIGRSKGACPKPIGTVVTALPGDPATGAADETWDSATVESTVDGISYQSGSLSALRRPSDLLGHLNDVFSDVDPTGDLAIFTGTVPLLDGTFRHGKEWTLALRFGGHTLTHRYSLV